MKRIYQTDVTRDTGNCLQACVASMLRFSTFDTVPHFKEMNKEQPTLAMKRWFVSQGYSVIETGPNADFHGTDNVMCIVAVKSDTGLHAVLGRTDGHHIRLLHDPNPNSVRVRGKKIKKWIRAYFIFQGSRHIPKRVLQETR